MRGFDDAHPEGRILHVHPASADPLLAYHLKRLGYANEWQYRAVPLQQLSNVRQDKAGVVVLDFFAQPLVYPGAKAELEEMLEGSSASFLLVFPRAFSANVSALSGVNCEYCFLGLDGMEEITLRVELVRARSAKFQAVCNGFRWQREPASVLAPETCVV